MEKVTVDDVVALARETFQGGEVSLATLGPLGKGDLHLGCLQFD